MKKAGISFAMIGIAILVLVTVAVVIGIFTGYLGEWSEKFDATEDRFAPVQCCSDDCLKDKATLSTSKGGTVKPSITDCENDDGRVVAGNFDDTKGQVCCVDIP